MSRIGNKGLYTGDFIYIVSIVDPNTVRATQQRDDWFQDAWIHAREAAKSVVQWERFKGIKTVVPDKADYIEFIHDRDPADMAVLIEEWRFQLNGYMHGNFRVVYSSEELRPTFSAVIGNKRVDELEQRLAAFKSERQQVVEALSTLPLGILDDAVKLAGTRLNTDDLERDRKIAEQ